ncbi:hypothetical protein J437_LFUL005142 [Ladona fulva]|uniref:AMP-dependent synthetase/ligase domain-containing protein n=1 Tax=Ladona fulva TaxID=123851 RepID=A0A8K0KHA2_LADFU|nr:hypothetical protein J437_LFUL005142 [Ladona fulva]
MSCPLLTSFGLNMSRLFSFLYLCCNQSTEANMTSDNVVEDENIVKSPFAELAKQITFPEISLAKFIFQALKLNEKWNGDTPALIDAVQNKAILFKEIEPLSRKFATSLSKLGFQKGDVLYYVTYNASLLYVLQFGVWLCGGAVRGCFQTEEKEELERQMHETKCCFILCDSETASTVKWAVERLDWPTQLMSIDGEVEGAKPVEDMVYKDDIQG